MPKVKKKRLGFVIDMTPLVDITFLLLTFFMFTAKFKTEAEAEQQFYIERPQASADTSKMPEQDLAVIKIAIDSVDQDTSYYYSVVNEEDRKKVWENVEGIPAQQKDQALLNLQQNMDLLSSLVKTTRQVNSKTQFAIDADRRIKFKWISQGMDVLRKNRATAFKLVTKKRE